MCARYLIALLFLVSATAGADFSDSSITLHPGLPFGPPFIVEVSGEWPTDCHPGEQKAVISEYTGESALIEFETIVEHVTCNQVETAYRVLVDFSEVLDVAPASGAIDITVRYAGEEIDDTFLLDCAFISPCPNPQSVYPEPGVYHSETHPLQGLLLARQGERLAAYPLAYDEQGSSEWLFAAGGLRGNTFFGELFKASGGQCLGCDADPSADPSLEPVGALTLLMDSEGIVQMKIGDGEFIEYRPLEFGYGTVDLGGNPQVMEPDLTGRWAIAESDVGILASGSIPPASVLPHVFDLTLIGTFEFPEQNYRGAEYLVSDLQGDEFSMMRCEFYEELDCVIENPQFSDGSHGVIVIIVSPERLQLIGGGPILGVGRAARGAAVRID